MSPEMGAMQKAIEDSFAAFSLGVNIRGGFDVQTSVLLKDAQGAATVKTGVDSGLAELRKTFDSAKMTAPPLFAELGEQLLNNLKVETKDQVVKVTTNLPDSDQQKIEQVPPLLMMMAMTGGLGSGGASPFGGPPKSLSQSSGGMPPDFKMPSMAGGKNPGQTDPVEAQFAEGLPDGTTLLAMASWSQFPVLGPDMKAAYPMQLILDVKGDDLQGICGYGQVTFKVLSAAEGGNLKVAKTQSLVHGNVVKMLLP
eukprot:TRINITY_DN35674_c0_g1_i2.p1 TRINITY_DN35674_c0_g1~~TRINITY_DN35674_c0_g1_i2.p1  ORF type:complete len:290 (+),score=32.26 TRINITY_DN35674_c0_g1_i2:111-872(+)